MGRLRADLDMFSEGMLIVVGRGSHNSCYMKQLDPTEDEIWEIRSRDPKPSLRLLGAFAARDVFVGIDILARADLGGPASAEWADAIRLTKAEWRKMFITYPRHRGEALNEYISDDVIDQRDIER